MIEVANKTDADGDLVQGGAGHVASANLASPAIANVNFPVTGVHAVSDHKVICQPVFHAAYAPVVMLHALDAVGVIAAVVNDDVFPAAAPDAGSVDFR